MNSKESGTRYNDPGAKPFEQFKKEHPIKIPKRKVTTTIVPGDSKIPFKPGRPMPR